MSDFFYKYFAYLIFPSISLILSLILTTVCVKLMPVLGLVAMPGGRHIHNNPTPKGGGISVALAFFISWCLFLYSPWKYFIGTMDFPMFLKIVIHGGFILVLGLIDDAFNLRARYKLIFQALVALSCWFFGIRIGNALTYNMNDIFSLSLTVLWILGFINAFNLIDGMDGLATGLAIIASICMASVLTLQHAPLDTVVVFCLAAACLGFLRFNFHPAKIFLGDTGSMFLGFMFAIIGIISSTKAATISSILIPLLAVGVPFFDVFLAIWRRAVKTILSKIHGHLEPNGIMYADKEHIHHRILEEHKDHKKAVLIIYSIAIMLAVFAVLIQVMRNRAQGLTLILLIIISVTIIRRLAIYEMWNSAKLIIEGLHKPRDSVVLSLLHPFFDMSILILTFILTFWLLSSYELKSVITKYYIQLVYYISPIVIILHIGRVYQRFWMRACSKDYVNLIELLLIGNIVAGLIDYQINGISDPKMFFAFHLFFFFVSTSSILSERMFIRYIKTSIISKNLYLKRFAAKNIPKVLVYGAGMRCLFFLTNRYNRIEEDPFDVIGIIDDNRALWGQMVYGYKVLGGREFIQNLHEKYKFDELVIACHIKDGKDEIGSFCINHGVKLKRFELCEN